MEQIILFVKDLIGLSNYVKCIECGDSYRVIDKGKGLYICCESCYATYISKVHDDKNTEIKIYDVKNGTGP